MRMVFYIHLGTWVERFVLIVATNVWLVYGGVEDMKIGSVLFMWGLKILYGGYRETSLERKLEM